MIETERKLREDKAKLTQEQRKILNVAKEEKRDLTSDENIKYEQMEEKKDELRTLIAAEEKTNAREERLAADEDDESRSESDIIPDPDISGPEKRKEPDDKDDTELRSAFVNYCRTGREEEYRALQADIATQAGYVVAPEKFVSSVIQDINDQMYIRQKAKKFKLTKAGSMGVPKRTADTSLTFGKRQFVPRPATGEILVSKTLLRNAAINVESYVREELAYEASEFQEELFFTGSGSGEPLGIFTASDDGISTSRDVSTDNTTSSMTIDGLKNAKWALKKGHRKNAEWIFHRDGVKQIDKLQDGNGRYYWEDSVKVGEPDRFLGMPVSESELAPNTFTTGLYVGILGDFRHYWIVDDLAWELQVLMELYARQNQVDFLVRFEFDGCPTLEEAFVRVTLG